MIIIIFINNKKYINLLLIVVLIALLPVCFNFVGIIFPEHEMTPLMLTPNFIILFFVIYLLKYIYLYKITSCLLCMCLNFFSQYLNDDALILNIFATSPIV